MQLIVLLSLALAGWRGQEADKPNEWMTVESVRMDPANPKTLVLGPAGPQGILVNGKLGKTVNLVTTEKYGDVEAEIEFLVPQGSNSGVYFQGLYEIQILDSFGNTDLKFGDCGGVYARYIDGKSVGGAAPRVNASKPPGEWQTFHVWFRAPRFDAGGKKIRNARFEKVLHNGVLIHENVEVEGPTRASMSHAEAPTGPLMLQGDHGPVAFRRISVRRLRNEPRA
jgi:hypothetical protein